MPFSTILRVIAVFLGFLLTACASPQGYIDFSRPQQQAAAPTQQDEKAPLRIAFASVMSPRETRQAYEQVVQYIGEKDGRPTVLLQRRTYAELNKLMATGGADIAFFSTGAYSAYQGRTPIELLAMVQTKGTIFYNTYIITASDSAITDFDQLEGKVFAFTDPMSYSGKLAIDFLLMDKQTTPESFFSQFFYTYNHDKSLWAVANHLADAASLDSQIYDYVLQANPHLKDKVRIIAVLPQAPTGPVVMRSSLSTAEKEKLRQIFYTMDEEPALHDALQQAVIDQFVPPEASLYDELRQKYALQHRQGGPDYAN